MSVLRKKIDNNLVAPSLDESKTQNYWMDARGRYFSECEAMIGHLHWAVKDMAVSQNTLDEFKTSLPEQGLYVGFGPDEKDTRAMMLLDSTLAAIIAKHGFSGHIADFDDLEDYQISKLDMMLMNSFVSATQDILAVPEWSNCSHFLDVSEIPFSPDVSNCVLVEFAFEVSFGPKSAAVPITFKLMTPHYYMESKLETFIPQMVDQAEIDFDENSEILSRHIDKSVTSLRAVLESCKMTVADCTRLEIGQVIRLPGVSLQDMRLEAEFRDSRICVAKGALGIHKTKRAVKLAEDLEPNFVQNNSNTP